MPDRSVGSGQTARNSRSAIRSALAAGDTLRLYSGAGIVGGSHPDREWDEIENKIDNYLKLLAGP